VATNVHYKPLPLFTGYKDLGYKIEDYPNAYELYRGEITLPLHTLLSDQDVDYVIKQFRDAYYTVAKEA
jgi:dTDP-4-amino-4,6-dideoxygalactose transaminase